MIDLELRGDLDDSAYRAYLRKIDFMVDALGAMTEDQIRKLLQLNGAKGHPASPCGCPIAVYLRNLIGRKVWVESARAIPIQGRDDLPADVLATQEDEARWLPDSVRRFILNFDQADYPELVAE